MNAKTERFEMRLDQSTLDAVDAWRARQDDLPSRAEAVRRLMEEGLAVGSARPLSFSAGEKLTLTMLCDLYKHLKVRGDIDPAFVNTALGGGHSWGFGWEYPGLFDAREDSPRVVSEVVDILDMWDMIEISYAKLGKKEKERLADEAKPLGSNIVFRGFDGNNESEYLSVATFVIKSLERFSTFGKRDLNSHMPLVDAYRRMYRVFEPMRRNLMGGILSAAQLTKIVKVMVHPDNRKS